ncbi:MAG: lamin tail domain-containing protein [Candidatus Cloacimonetes bacterium]|nr:lamin tail domain-containing protein [Candidatus Cloacimonadota bacterium]
MLKKLILVLSLLAAMGLVFAQTTINFDDAAKWTAGSVSITSYAVDHTYVDGVFSATGGPALRNTPSTQDGYPGALGAYSWRLQNLATVEWIMTISTGGVGDFSVDVRRWDASPSPDLTLDYSTDGGTNWVNVTTINNAALDDLSAWKTFNGTINSANANIKIRFKANSAGERIMVDNFVWSGFGGGNVPPNISNILQTPSVDIQATTTVSISADVTDSDGTVSLVQLKWGTTTGTYPNTINMTVGTAPTYTTVSNIPAQPAGTTVYYVIYAVDDDTDSSTSAEHSYTVIEPETTTVPYYEPFNVDLGDCYVFSSSGATKNWVWDDYSGNGFAYMSGYNTGDLEDDWLILPGIDFTAYSDLQMSFDTWYNYGSDDVNNYLKLKYSTDYAGIGDPYLATWAEIPYTAASTTQTWSSSGVLDLSGITGTSVWLGFQYHYNAGSYRNWEVDNISIELAPEDPVIYVAPITLSGFSYEFGSGPSSEQSFTVSGLNLTANISISAPTDYEIALVSGGPFASSQTLVPVAGTVAETTIYVRLKSGLAVGEYNNEVINITSTGADPQTVTCSGEVTSPPPPDAPVALEATNVGGTGFTANWSAVTGATGYYLDVYTVGGAAATDLIISEYVEGTSYRKGLEIYNGTGTAVDLANYSLMKQTNGAGDFGNELVLSGTLPNNDVYVIAYSSESAGDYIIGDYVDLYTSSSAVNYNGNDAIALYNTGVQTDVVGIVNQVTPDWGKDVTLVRKSTITMPTASYSIDDWDVYDVNTLDYLGYHLMGSINYVTGYQNLDVGNVTTYPVTGLTAGTTYYYVVRAYNAYGTSDDSNAIEVPVGAEIVLTVVNEADLFNIPGYPSDEFSTYQVVGQYLTDTIYVAAPAYFEVSTSPDSGYGQNLELPYDFSGNIYVRLNTWEIGEHSGVLTLSSLGAQDATAQLIGETVEPSVTWNISETLTAFSHEVGTPSASQTYILSATGAYSSSTLDLTVDGPFEISSSASGPWSAALSLAYDFNGSVYVRMNAGAVGYFTGSIMHETTDASPATVNLEGTATPPAGNFASDLFFSEYIEGSSNNKAIEIFNGTGAAVDLSDYQFENWYNGLLTPSIVALTGTLAHGDVYVLANPSSIPEILALADDTPGNVSFNGDDALALRKISTDTIVDIFGCIGEDPGTQWGTEPEWTINKTMVRNSDVTGGVTVNPTTGFPTLTTEWTFYDIDTITYLGSHVFSPGGGLDTPVVQITEAGGTITLTWDAITGATYYEIWSGTDPFGTYTLAEGNWTGTTWSETSAVMKFYKVIAKN